MSKRRDRLVVGVLAGVRRLPFSDNFNRADGDLANGWEYTAGKWTIATNAAVGTPGLGAELLTDGGLENWASATDLTSWTEGVGGTSTVNQETVTIHGGSNAARLDVDASNNTCRISQALANALADWMHYDWWGRSSTSGKTLWFGDTDINGPPRDPGITWTNFINCIRALRANTSIFLQRSSAASASLYFDDVSAKKITLADMFATRDFGQADVDVSVEVTRVDGTVAGLVLCLDSKTSPANFAIVYLSYADNGAVRLNMDKCVGGTYTNLISAAVTYGAGNVIRATKTGNTFAAYYNGSQVGTNQTISDAGIVNNTRHGMFNSYSGNALDDFSIANF